LEKAKAQYESELQALRGLISQARVPGQGQGSVQADPGRSRGFADELAQSGELQLIQKIAEDPEMGLGHAMYAMAQAFDRRVQGQLEALKAEAIEPIVQRNEKAQAVSKVFGAARQLATAGYPELDDSNHSPEAEEAQAQILEVLKTFPPEFLVQNPDRALRMAVLEYREANGTPVFAQRPGTSGSPSVRAAMAAETPGVTPLDGVGTPRPRPGGVETAADRIRRENREVSGELRTPSGRMLGFSA
jgi:hypothetical protein